MKWIKFSDKEPPNAEDVLVVKQYLDAPYGPNGYESDKEFWTNPTVMVDCYWAGGWHNGGRVKYWAPLPKMPEES